MELIKIRVENGQQLVSARELYEFLGTTERFSSWFERYCKYGFEENIDFTSVKNFTVVNNGAKKELQDYAMTIEMAKEFSMLQRTERGKEARKYFIACERKLKQLNDPYKNLSPELRAIISIDAKIQEIEEEFNDFKGDMPLFNVDCKELQAAVKKKGIEVLGGYRSIAYCDNSLRSRTYKDIQFHIKSEFGVSRYEAIKRKHLNKALEIVRTYKAPFVLQDEIIMCNNQSQFNI